MARLIGGPTALKVLQVLLGLALAARATAAADPPPVAPVRPVTDDYFGTKVVDQYRYLENLDNADVQAWMRSQADFTRRALEALPGRGPLFTRIHALNGLDLRRGDFVRRGKRLFYQVREPGAELRKLFYRDGVDGVEHQLVDPAALGKGTATHYALDFFMPSWDGRLVAYGVSKGGSEESVLHVLHVETGSDLGEAIDRTSDSVVAWRPDNRSFFYLRYRKLTPEVPASERMYNARTFLHKLGVNIDGEGDPAVFGRGVTQQLDVPEGQGTFIVLAPDSPYALAVANHNMDNNPSTLYLAPLQAVTGGQAPWRKIADVEDGMTAFQLHGDSLIYLSQKNASNFQLLSTPLSRPDVRHPHVIVPESDVVITDFAVAPEGIYLRERAGAVTHIRRSSFDGKKLDLVQTPFGVDVSAPVADVHEAGVLFTMQGWSHPPVEMSYDPSTNAAVDTGLIPPSKIDTSQVESRDVFATSYDGTRIPLSIIYKRGIRLDGRHPTILQGYGAYGIAWDPEFEPTALAWVERDGVMAIAHVRGGGEYGENWHLAGQKKTKLNTVFDLIACAEYLVDEHYTSTPYLAGHGISAGGITIGRAMTLRPDLFGVIFDQVGFSDTLRFETEPNGPPNTSELGSIATEDGFHELYAMSSYAGVRSGAAYPAVIFATGINDPRVAPWHMLKMAAKTQATTSSGRPVLLRIDYDAGHGIGSTTSQKEALLADLWSFALWQMGDAEFQPGARQ